MSSAKESPEALSHIDVEKTGATATSSTEDEPQYPGWRKLTLIMAALYLAMFLVALDRTIIGTAIPKITDDFHSINDVGWYASSYLITLCAFQLIYGRIYTFYSAKWVLLSSILIFEVGSAVCGAAPSSVAFIIGRAVAGLGSAGIFSGCVITMVISIPLHRRPMFQGIFGAVFGVASVCGPLIGGAFTTRVTWRWCFWINLPIGAVVATIILFILTTPPSKNTDTVKEQIMKLDPYGSAVFLPGIVCLLLALQWGGTNYSWSNARIIVLFILAGILFSIFVAIQFKSGDRATVPIRIIKQRSIASGAFFSMVSPGSMMVIIYFLPLWFQAVKGVTAEKSGIDTLPLVLSLVVASILSGAITQKSGYYVGQLIASSIISSIGAGLLTTLQPDSSSSKWIGYQFIYGFGLGLGMQQASMAAQACLEDKDVMTGVSLMFFMQGLGGAIFVVIGQTVFTQSLVSNLGEIGNFTASQIINTGATELKNLVPPQMMDAVLLAYNTALTDTLKVAVGLSAATIIAGLTMEWKNLKNKRQGGAAGELEAKQAEEEAAQENGLAEAVPLDKETSLESTPRNATPTTPEKKPLH
ncbi:uncharacterized protein BP5553_03825 [Venustampulla echinocandica]|uniref:Major facilitator superfamily (MFS) profile domain-containing protein n=1 Tax=Venustampulla echinocandica TaxID=2656787 RepID=A0A370TVB6_9HELO|nr:uncharacterized protein BP5553_03825 [Venustampulla echinocandica]RDL39485.1 hypothetical protein BP5553_03825 [Venustampulla echinocandica]